jgi:hypothetical protein
MLLPEIIEGWDAGSRGTDVVCVCTEVFEELLKIGLVSGVLSIRTV